MARPHDPRPRIPRGPLSAVIAVALGLAAMTVGRIVILRLLFDLIRDLDEGTALVSDAFALGAALAGIALAAAWLRGKEWALSDRIGFEHAHEWRMLAYRRLQTTAPDELQRRGHGAVLLRYIGDLGGMGTWAARGVAQGLAAAAVIAAAVITLGVMSLWMGITLLVLSVFAVALAGLTSREIGERAARTRRQRARLANRIADHISHVGVIQLYGRSGGERARVERASRALSDEQVGLAAARARLRALAEAMAGITAVSVVLVGAAEVAAGRTSPGTVVAAVLVSRQLTSPLRRLMQFHDHRQRGRLSRGRLVAYLGDEGIKVAARRRISRGPAAISLRHVSVAGRLHDVTGEVSPGSRVAVVGTSGSGKSSLLSVIAGFVAPDTGRVRIDGRNVHDSPSTRRRIGMVGPDLPLLRESISRNLRYGDRNAAEAEVTGLVARLGLDETLAARPGGQRNRILDGGSNIAAGERRRLELARALLGSPDLLLLDEPQAGLDPEGADLVTAAIEGFTGTVVFTTSDPEAAAGADVVWQLQGGRLLASDTSSRETS